MGDIGPEAMRQAFRRLRDFDVVQIQQGNDEAGLTQAARLWSQGVGLSDEARQVVAEEFSHEGQPTPASIPIFMGMILALTARQLQDEADEGS